MRVRNPVKASRRAAAISAVDCARRSFARRAVLARTAGLSRTRRVARMARGRPAHRRFMHDGSARSRSSTPSRPSHLSARLHHSTSSGSSRARLAEPRSDSARTPSAGTRARCSIERGVDGHATRQSAAQPSASKSARVQRRLALAGLAPARGGRPIAPRCTPASKRIFCFSDVSNIASNCHTICSAIFPTNQPVCLREHVVPTKLVAFALRAVAILQSCAARSASVFARRDQLVFMCHPCGRSRPARRLHPKCNRG